MDLRTKIKPAQLSAGIELIRNTLLGYQPFILADDIEVGEGFNFANQYAGVKTPYDLNAYAKGIDLGRLQPSDLSPFRQFNAEYRAIYDYVCNQIAEHSGGIEGKTFGEIGCNTGINLFNLAVRGGKCTGYDWTDYKTVFAWLDDILGTNVGFRRASYDNLTHTSSVKVKEVDVMINTVFTNHQCDPLQFLCFLCDRARKGVFLWILTENIGCAVHYPAAPPHEILEMNRPFPLFFNNGVAISESLLKISLDRLGFEDFRPIKRFVPGPRWDNFQTGFQMYYAARTKDVRSAYWHRRFLPTAKRLSRRLLGGAKRLPRRLASLALRTARGNLKRR